MDWVAALLIAAATATPPDFSQDSNLRVLAPSGQLYETSVAVSGNNVVIAVINHDDNHPIDLFVSPNRGFTWSAPIEMPKTIDGKAHRYGTDPTLAVLDDGSFALGYLVIENTPSSQTLSLGDERLVFLRSSDGVTWSAPVTLAAGNSGINPYIDRPWLSVDRVRGTVFATWSRTEGSAGEDVVLQTSADRGATWSAPAAVTPKREELGQIAALPNGTLVEVNYDGTRKVFVSRYSSSGGAFWSAPVVLGDAGNAFISPGTKTQSPPLAVLLTVRDDLYTVLPTASSIAFTRSRDGGRTWSAPLQLGGATGDAVLPSLAVDDASGTIFVSWMDGRDDATNATLRLYGTRSADGGTTFEAPRAFSSPFTAGGRIADTEGMVSLGDGTALKAFSPAGGYVTAARLSFVTRRRAANH
jgi:hypothetical protein